MFDSYCWFQNSGQRTGDKPEENDANMKHKLNAPHPTYFPLIEVLHEVQVLDHRGVEHMTRKSTLKS